MTKRLTKQQRAALPLLNDAKDMLKGPYRAAVQKAIDLIEGRDDDILTNLTCDALPPGGKLIDPRHPGLMLKHGKRTGRRWFYRTTKPLGTTQVEILIGAYPDIGISEARDHRAQMAKVRNTGKLPSPSAVANSAGRKTVGDLLDWYLSDYCDIKRASSTETDRKIIERYLRPEFGTMAIEDWTADRITGFIQFLFNATTKGRQAEKVRTIISTMNNAARGQSRLWAGKLDWLADVPNPMQGVAQLPKRDRIKGKARENYKPRLAEMRALMENAHALGQPNTDAIMLQALTCARISEVTNLTWPEIDIEAGTWTLPADRAKNGREHIVMLPSQAVDLLKARKDIQPGPWVFPSLKWPDEAMSSETVMKAIAANRDKLGVADKFTSHAIRHGCLTWCAENGIGREIRDRISNHAPPAGVDSEYVSAELHEPAKRALQRWADAITQRTAQVVQLKA